MTIRKFIVQLSFIFALIIGFTACEKDPITNPVNGADNQVTQVTNGSQTKSYVDCEEFLAMYTGEELAELGIDPETFCDEMDWEGDEDEWNDIDWEMDCESLVAMYADELEAFGFDPQTFCEDIFDGITFVEIDFEDVTVENCDSLVAMYADELVALGIDPATFCDEWNGNGNDDWDDINWSMDCDSIVATYADQFEEWGIDPTTFCDEWNGEWNGNDDWDEWGDIDWSTDCDTLVVVYADQLEEWGLDPATFCDEWGGDWSNNWDYEDAVYCMVQTACGVLVYGEEVEVVAENDLITIYNADGDVLSSIECEDTTVEVNCY